MKGKCNKSRVWQPDYSKVVINIISKNNSAVEKQHYFDFVKFIQRRVNDQTENIAYVKSLTVSER